MEGHVDDNMVLSDAQVVGTGGADEASDDQVRLPVDASTDELGPGNPLYLNAQVVTTFTGGTSIGFSVQDAADTGSDAPDTFADIGIDRTRTVANNQLDAGKKVLSVALPPGTREWVRLHYAVTGSMTAGAIDAWISDHPLTGVD